MLLTLPQAERQKHGRISNLCIRMLQLLGYRFASISEALRGPAEKYVCLCAEHTTADLLSLPVAGTLFVCISDLSTNNWDQVLDFKNGHWEIACSGLTHQNLTELSYAEQQSNVLEARSILKEKLNADPKVFSYPMGAYDATTVSVVRDAGFEAAVSTARGVNSSTEQDAYHLRRLTLPVSTIRQLLTLTKYTLLALPESGTPLLSNAGNSRRRIRSGAIT